MDSSEGSTATLEDVSFSYGARSGEVLKDLHLNVTPGVTSVIGPSGCGKSTILALLSGLRKPTNGGVTWTHPPEVERGERHPLTMMFQKDTLLPWLTARENVMLPLRINGLHREASNIAFVDELFEIIGMSDVASRYPYQLSGGMRRRIAFVTSIALRPSVLLLDEPFSALDEPTRIAIHQDVHEVVRRMGVTVVLVTHDLSEAVSMSDQVVLMSKGPGRVAGEFHIDLGLDRDMLKVRETDDFLSQFGNLWHALREQITS